MARPRPPFLAWLTAAALLLFTSHALANSKIYQVEMIIFERGASSSAGDMEGGQKNVVLEYPDLWQRLVDPEEEAARQAQADRESALRLSDDFLQTLAQEREEQNQDDAPSPTTDEQSPAATGPKYFEFLPDEALGLRRTRDALTRRNHYRVLFHETWIQPINAPQKSPALILHGGKRYGDHYELQGYINLSVSRFLHIQTDLWFSEFSLNHGQDLGSWPQLPLEPHLAAIRVSPDFTDTERPLHEIRDVNLASPRQRLSWEKGAGNWRAEAEEPLYLVNQINTLRQKRRMRSGELHYLDHPRFGLLIKISAQ